MVYGSAHLSVVQLPCPLGGPPWLGAPTWIHPDGQRWESTPRRTESETGKQRLASGWVLLELKGLDDNISC